MKQKRRKLQQAVQEYIEARLSNGLRASLAYSLFEQADAVQAVLSRQKHGEIVPLDMPVIEAYQHTPPDFVVNVLLQMPHRRGGRVV